MISGASVLVVEDDEIVSALIGLMLAEHQHQVTNACDAESAWAILKSGQTFDAILLDRGLPGMDGIALLHRIKMDAQLSKIPVIIETGQDDIDSQKRRIASVIATRARPSANAPATTRPVTGKPKTGS